MAKSMNAASQILNRQTSTDLSNVTFSQALADGLTHSGWLVGPTTDPSGQEAAHASHSVLPERVEGLTMNVTFGQLFGGSSPSTDLQLSLASRLRQRMEGIGSPEYELTWKQWDMQSGPPICALRASALRTSGNGCFGWPTASSRDWKDVTNPGTWNCTEERNRFDQLGRAVHLIGSTPSSFPAPMESGGGCLAGWQTPKQPSGGSCERNTSGGGMRKLEDQTELLLQGMQKTSLKLNPFFSLWMMGYPIEWGRCAGLETPSCLN